MKAIETAVFLIGSASLAFAADLDLPALKYEQRAPGSLNRPPVLAREFSPELSSVPATNAPVLLSREALSPSKVYILRERTQKSVKANSGGAPSAEAQELICPRPGFRASVQYDLITREPADATATNESSGPAR